MSFKFKITEEHIVEWIELIKSDEPLNVGEVFDGIADFDAIGHLSRIVGNEPIYLSNGVHRIPNESDMWLQLAAFGLNFRKIINLNDKSREDLLDYINSNLKI